MNIPENHLHKLIDGLTYSNACLALYRLPWKEQPVLVLQREGNPDTYARLQDLNGKTGLAKGWPEIKETLADWESASEAMTPPNNDTAYAKDSRRAYAEAFSRFITPLRQGIFQKLVLARSEDMDLPAGFSPLATFINACNNYPRMMISLVHTPVTGTWIGSTPEIILSEEQDRWHTVSLAGTMPVVNEGMPEEWGRRKGRRPLHRPSRPGDAPEDRLLLPHGPHHSPGRRLAPTAPHPRRMRPAQTSRV